MMLHADNSDKAAPVSWCYLGTISALGLSARVVRFLVLSIWRTASWTLPSAKTCALHLSALSPINPVWWGGGDTRVL